MPKQKAILDSNRKAVFERMAPLSTFGGLAGGTALALQLGHRRSYDFDILTLNPVPANALSAIEKLFTKLTALVNTSDELTVSINNQTKISIVHFPFPPSKRFFSGFALPLWSILDIAGNKAYAIGRRGTYRDYVDLYAILKSGLELKKIITNATKRFGTEKFNERLFLEQLGDLSDLTDFTIEWLWPKVTQSQVERYLASRVKAHLAH